MLRLELARHRVSLARAIPLAAVTAFAVGTSAAAAAATGADTQARITRDLAAGQPIVVHVIVALCDNENQGVVPVPRALGNGQDADSNLYWGAQYGVRSFFPRRGGWTRLPVERPTASAIHERLVLYRQVSRADRAAPVYVVADAWDGASIQSAIETFLAVAAGAGTEAVTFRHGARRVTIPAGGSAHLAAFVGHNGLMDFSLPAIATTGQRELAGSSIVLACASKAYFLDPLRGVGSHPLLLTTGLMAPEAYTLDAAIRSWAQGGSVAMVREAAAGAYHEYQRCGRRAARNLFWGQEP